MTIYADQMFIENFIMNFIILYMTAKFLGIEVRWYKLSIGSSIGALYVIFSYVFLFYNNPMILAKIVLSFVMVYISFTPKRIKLFFRLLTYFYMITLFIGGVSFGLAYFFNVVTIYDGGVFYVEEFPVILVALGTVVAFIFGKYAFSFIKNRRRVEELVYKAQIELMGSYLELNSYYDSGHNVHEPFTNYPVIVVEKDVLKDVVPDIILDKIKNNQFDFDDKLKSRLRVIPISTVSSEKDVLVGIKTDSFRVYIGDEIKEVKNVILAICDKKLSKDGSYNALIGRDMLDQ